MGFGAALWSGIAVGILVIVAATALIWLGSGWLEESAETLSAYYGLPAVV